MSARWPVRLGRAYARWRLRRGLDGVHAAGLAHLRDALARGPVVLACTHVAWWDGLVMLAVDHAVGADARFVVDAASVRRMPFLSTLGAIGVDRGAPASARAGLRAARDHLSGPGRVVWVFPQGRERPAHLRPLGLQRGVAALAWMARARVVPVSLTYGFRDRPEPAAALAVGAPLDPTPDVVAALEDALVAGLDDVDRWLDGQGAALEPIVAAPGRRVQDGPWTRALGALTRLLTPAGALEDHRVARGG